MERLKGDRQHKSTEVNVKQVRAQKRKKMQKREEMKEKHFSLLKRGKKGQGNVLILLETKA